MHSSFKGFSVEYDEKLHSFSCSFSADGKAPRVFVKDAAVSLRSYSGERIEVSSFKKIECKRVSAMDGSGVSFLHSGGPDGAPYFELHFMIGADGVHVRVFARAIVVIGGLLVWGDDPERSTFGVRLNAEDRFLRAACGPSFALHDNALFDRLSDSALEFKAPSTFKVSYSWEASSYRFDYECGLDFGREFFFKVHEDFCRRKFAIPYAPIDKSHGFATPPVGWMTWYAVQFKANEALVLENAKRLVETLGKRSDKLCAWVDWEWNHNAFDGLGEKGVDVFHPRKEAYPRGLAKLAKELKKLGVVPALWTGATNDGQENALLKKHPAWVLAKKPEWCGQFWVDPSHPGVVKDYIPALFKQSLDWGYEALKWDCLPMSLAIYDSFHEKFAKPELSPEAALRGLVEAAREVVGEDFYLLSCSGETERDICFAMDLFSAARIGGDIFGWGDFIANSVDRVFRFYPWHNVVFYADADNLILREEFNTLAQARSRASFYGLAGLPLTIGDAFSALDEPRLEMLKRIVPVADIHPADLQRKSCGENCVLVNLAVNKSFGSWNVVDAMNAKDAPLELRLSLAADLHIDTRDGLRYAVYDFWKDKLLGVFDDALQLSIDPMDSAVLRVTPLSGVPQLVSVSSHITQGAVELEALRWDSAKRSLSAKARVFEGERSVFSVLLPEGFALSGLSCSKGFKATSSFDAGARLLKLFVEPECQGGVAEWTLSFARKASKRKER